MFVIEHVTIGRPIDTSGDAHKPAAFD